MLAIWTPELLPGNLKMSFEYLGFCEACGLLENLRALLSLILMIGEMLRMQFVIWMASMDGELSCPITLAAAVVVTVMEVQI